MNGIACEGMRQSEIEQGAGRQAVTCAAKRDTGTCEMFECIEG
jgi:hypothetical protein